MNFSNLDHQLANHGWAVLNNFLSQEQCQSFLTWGKCQADWTLAGTGRGSSFQAQSVRGDHILWIDQQKDKEAILIRDVMDECRQYFNQSLWLNLANFESHLAHYCSGKGYARHRDQFKIQNKRVLSAVFYLNQDWQSEDGGCLRLYLPEGIRDIEPVEGRAVFFMSEMEHEVLPSYADRWSIACWFLRSTTF